MVHATAGQTIMPLRVGMVGDGRHAFIGAVDRMAMRLDDQFELKAGALSADAENARVSGADLGLAPDRVNSDFREMAAREGARPDGIEAVAIVTPNHLHYPVAKAFLEAGVDVICDKPLSTSLAEAKELVELTRPTGLVFAVSLNNTGYPMVVGARDDRRGRDRRHPGRSRELHPGLADPADRRRGPEAGGVAHGPGARRRIRLTCRHRRPRSQPCALRLDAVSADLMPFVPGRRLDDNAPCAHALRRRRAPRSGGESGGGGQPLNNLSLKVFGTRAGLEWSGESPEVLRFTPCGEPPRTLQRGVPGISESAREGSRMPGGHPEGYIEGFANLHRDAAELIAARRAGRKPRPAAAMTPNVLDGARGVTFVEASVASSRSDGAWTSARLV
jgi:predicted dehydrogenase